MASSLIHKSTYEADNPLESSLIEAFRLLEPELRPPFPLTIRTEPEYFNLNRAILYGILSETHLAKVHLKHLHGIVTDGYCFFTNLVCKVVDELYSKLVENVKVQLVYVSLELVDVSAVGIDSLLVALLRQIRGGDLGVSNLWLCSEMVNLLWGKWECLVEEQPMIISSALYVFLRVLSDHCRVCLNSKLKVLKQKEIEFCIRVLRISFICTKNHIEANAKLPLFYDWLFFDEGVDSILNIEPVILLMVNSVSNYIHMTHNLLEFLFLLVDHYDIDRKDLISKGVSSAFDVLKRKGVIQSFDVLTCCDMLSPFLKERLVKILSWKNVSGFNHLQPVFLA